MTSDDLMEYNSHGDYLAIVFEYQWTCLGINLKCFEMKRKIFICEKEHFVNRTNYHFKKLISLKPPAKLGLK